MDRVRAKSKCILASGYSDNPKFQRIIRKKQVHFIVVICTSQELDFMVAVVKAHTEVDGDVFLNDDPSLREILHQ